MQMEAFALNWVALYFSQFNQGIVLCQIDLSIHYSLLQNHPKTFLPLLLILS